MLPMLGETLSWCKSNILLALGFNTGYLRHEYDWDVAKW
jgi:hypothetical protein